MTTTKTKTVAINAFVFMVPIMSILYTGAIMSSGSQDNGNDNNGKKIVGCDNNGSIRTKMFDSQVVPNT
jgi:hypothetical protein